MPLTEFTEKAVAGLVKGDAQIAIGQAAVGWEAHEKGKEEKASQAYVHVAKLLGQS